MLKFYNNYNKILLVIFKATFCGFLFRLQTFIFKNKLQSVDIFKTVKRLFDLENPTHSPIFTEFRTVAKREL